MIVKGVVTVDTKLSELNIYITSDRNKTAADLIRKFGICKFDGGEYVLIIEPMLDNGSLPNDDFDAFCAPAIKLNDEWEHDTIYGNYGSCPYCKIYELKWYIHKPISYDDFWYRVSLGDDFSELKKGINWNCPNEVR